jgi:hypothetical protein
MTTRPQTPFIETQGVQLLTAAGDPRPHLRAEYFRSRRAGAPATLLQDPATAAQEPDAWEPIERDDLLRGETTLADGSVVSLHRLVITTDAGVGKTTNMRWLNTHLTRTAAGSIAFLIQPGWLSRRDGPSDWLHLLRDQLIQPARQQLSSKKLARRESLALDLLVRLRDEGQLTILYDALDQSDAKHVHLLEDLLEPRWHQCRVDISGRPHALRRYWEPLFARRSDWRFVQLDEFAEDEQRRYLGETADGQARFERISSEARTILGVPRVLEYISFEVPDSELELLKTPSDVYWRATQNLIARGLDKEHSKIASELGGGRLPPADQCELAVELLAGIAFEMTADQVLRAPQDETSDALDPDDLPALKSNFDAIPPTRYRDFRDKVYARLSQSKFYQGVGYDAFAADLNRLAAMNTVLSNGFFDNAMYEGLTSVLWRNRSLQEFFTAVWLSRYYAGDTTYDDADGRRLQDWIYLPDDPLSEDYYEIWRYAAEMPAEGRSGPHWVRALRALYQPGDGTDNTRRSNEILYRSWPTMTGYASGRQDVSAIAESRAVLRAFRSEFEETILAGNRGAEAQQAARECVDSFVWLEVGEFKMGTPEEKQGRMPDSSREFWTRWLEEGQDDHEGYVDRHLDRIPYAPGKAGERQREEDYQFFLEAHRNGDIEAIKNALYATDETPEVPLHQSDTFGLSHSPTPNAWYRLYDPSHGLRQTEYQSIYADSSPTADRPVIYVTWYDAWMFCQWASWERTVVGCPASTHGSMPPRRARPATGITGGMRATSTRRSVTPTGTRGVRRRRATHKRILGGLRDMLGNVQEWCDDWYRRKYSRDATDQTSAGVLRGASWGSDAVVRRSSFRNYSPPTTRNYLVGFTTTPVPIKSVKRRKLPLDRRLHLKRLRMRMRALKGFALPPAAPRCPSSGLVELAFFRTAEPKAPQLAPRGCKAPISWPERTAEVHRTAAGWGRPRQFDPMFDRAQEEETEGSFRRFD